MRFFLRAALLALTCVSAAAPTSAIAAKRAPKIGHVFVVVLENEDYDTTFGAGGVASYLRDLTKQGAFLTDYYATGHASLGNYITMISGQPETPATQADCEPYREFTETAATGADGIAIGDGCVYPAEIKTLADQLEARNLTWRGYMEDMGQDVGREPATCGRPDIGGHGVLKATPTDAYAYRHNPFIYFHSIIDRPAACSANDVNLDRLPKDLKSVATTPSYSMIVPNVCDDGHDHPCKDGRAGGLITADIWLRQWIPMITSSPAFKKDGLLVITFDEAASDSSRCCSEPSGPNAKQQGVNGPGGGRIGAILLSPFIKPGMVLHDPMNHYSQLRSIEDIFGLGHLGYAADDTLNTFAPAYKTLPAQQPASHERAK